MLEPYRVKELRRRDIRRKISAGLASLRCGESIDGEQALERLQKKSQTRRRRAR